MERHRRSFHFWLLFLAVILIDFCLPVQILSCLHCCKEAKLSATLYSRTQCNENNDYFTFILQIGKHTGSSTSPSRTRRTNIKLSTSIDA